MARRLSAEDIGGWTSRAFEFLEGAAISLVTLLFSLVLVVVVSVYMLLDFPRLSRWVDGRWPGAPPLTVRAERALAGYVTGQLAVSLSIGASAGLGLWALGALGWADGVGDYALVFGSWVAVMELIPYLGPWLGAVPPFVYALVVDPVSAIWIGLLFLAIHQIEGHIVIPNVMGTALRLHPLLVIFGLLAGAEIYGLPGALVALPLLAVCRALWEFFSGRVALEPWVEQEEREEQEEPLPKPSAVVTR
ncbi:MAG: AI-2E family transporter [Actinomycetota bacterium]|nr:AI-2E family transporter [Actinomycetota bacterium]